MAVVVAGSRGRGEQQRLPWREGQQEARSPDMAPPRPPRPRSGPARAAVVYYLSRNGHLEHPHFMEVALASPDGLCLRDVIDRLDALRGKGMARMYAWASKRSYRNGFVWHDLADDDYIYPVAGREYVLKGTERLHAIQLPLLDAAAASSCSSGSQETATSSPPGWDNGGGVARHKKSSGNPTELGEYRVYKAEDPAAAAADAATQTEDGYRSGRGGHQRHAQRGTAAQEELSTEETSPPTASTSPETLEALIKADGRVMAAVAGGGRTRASSVLMQLISCGSVSVKSALASPVMPRTAHYRARPPRHPTLASTTEIPAYRQKIVEDKEYFSGSLVETKRSSPANTSQDLAVLRRSSSYNADRAQKVEPTTEAVGMHDRCIPRRSRGKKADGGYLVISGNAQYGGKKVGG
ncbi:protein SOSEKI 2-like isoform X2 [Oryza brachyantha]|uniref:protein SOSEKI 2-like isoform X2 n=1 Tax=Oryza brachyantha TaxID=4533 RepID=UPI001ADD16AD|nr:protein SOSEKI 2-like isoform X2 [Oryza brachyantha]